MFPGSFRPPISGRRGAPRTRTGCMAWLRERREAHRGLRRPGHPTRRGCTVRIPEPRPLLGERFGPVRIFTAADLMAEDLPPVRWVVPDILPEGVTFLAG